LAKVNPEVFDYSTDSVEKSDLEKVFDTKVSFGGRDS
jgi:hypothetical protein